MATLAPPVPAPDFRFVGGDPALDLVNTVDWTAEGLRHERLPDYAALVAWATDAGAIVAGVGDRLRRRAAARPREARAVHARALRLRALLHDLFGDDGVRRTAALREFNPLLGDALGRLELEETGTGGLRWAWGDGDRRLEALLWPVLRSAADLLVSAEAERVRTCAGPDCGWMYVDRSRNGFRRWCQMQTCGTREKTRRRRTGETD